MDMSQADLIREHAKERYVEAARDANQRTLTIVARDMAHDLGLSKRFPNICQALQSRKFLDMAGVQLLSINGPPQGASTEFHYAIKSSGTLSHRLAVGQSLAKEAPKPAPNQVAAAPTDRDGLPLPPLADCTVVIQCAARKVPNAGQLTMPNGKPILFVADPVVAPSDPGTEYCRPDDIAPARVSWREALANYNKTYQDSGANPLALLPAWRLYQNSTYRRLVDRLGEDSVFILSAGWGLIPATFLTPNYDITFANTAEGYKRCRTRDQYADFCMLPKGPSRCIVFLGGQDYVPLFCRLTAGTSAERVVYHVGKPPVALNFRVVRYETNRRTNWHYECARTLA